MSVVSSGQNGFAAVEVYSSGILISAANVINNVELAPGSNDLITIASGGEANSVTVSSGASMMLASGGTATNVELKAGAVYGGFSFENDYSWEAANGEDFSFGDHLRMSGTELLVSGEAQLTKAGIYSGALMEVCSSGAVISVFINSSGCMSVGREGVANNTVINANGLQILVDSGRANNTIVNSMGKIIASNGGVANSAGIYSGGVISVGNGGFAANVVIHDGGTVYVSSGGAANNASLAGKNARLDIYCGGTAAYTVVSKGQLEIGSAASASYTTVNSGGRFVVNSSARASNTTLNKGAFAIISSGGSGSKTTVKNGAELQVAGKHGGTLNIESGASVNVHEGGVIDFTVAGRLAAEGYLINDLSQISGSPSFSITISATQSKGIYKLAQGAEGFDAAVSIGTANEHFGYISVGSDPLVYGDFNYVLNLESGNLSLTVSPGTSVIPGAATDLKVASNASSESATLSWKKPAGDVPISSYRIVVNGREYTSKTTSITISGLDVGVNIFRVYAVNESGSSGVASVGKQFNVVDKTAPEKVSGVFISDGDDGTVNFSWGAVTDNAGVALYEVKIDKKTYKTSETSLAVKGLASGKHTLSIRAKDEAGNAGEYYVYGFDVADETAPEQVSGLKVAAKPSSKAVKLSWKKPKDNVKVVGYQVMIDGVSHFVTGTSLKLEGLTKGTHGFSVCAVDAAGNKSLISDTLSFDVADATAPDVVTGIRAVAGANNLEAELFWDAAYDNTGVASYLVYVDGKLKEVDGSETSVTLAGLKTGTHSVKIYAVDADRNKSKVSATYKFVVSDAIAPERVTGLKVSGKPSSKSAKLSWKKPKDNVKVTGYEVYIDGDFYTCIDKTSLSVSGLSAGVHEFYVRAFDAAGNVYDGGCEVLEFNVAEAENKFGISGVNVALGADSFAAELSWDAAAVTGLAGYQIFVDGKFKLEVDGSETSVILAELKTGTRSVVIYAVDAYGERMDLSDSYKFMVSDATAPEQVTGLKVSGKPSSKSAKLSWKKPKDNVKVTGYEVCIDDGDSYFVTGTSITLKEFAVGDHSFKVYAFDAAGNRSEVSESFYFNVADKTAPGIVDGIEVGYNGSDSVLISWNDADDNDAVASYLVYIDNKRYVTSETSLVVTKLSDKIHSVKIYAEDAAGNKGKVSETVKFSVADIVADEREAAYAAKRDLTNNTMADATDASGSVIDGVVDLYDTVDWYWFEINEADILEAGSVTFGVGETSGMLKTSLCDSTGQLIDSQELIAGTAGNEMVQDLSAGIYYFCVEKCFGASEYTVSFLPEDEEEGRSLLKSSTIA